MNIKQIDLFRISIPLFHPFETSFGVIDSRASIIIRIESTNDLVGWGESPTLELPLSEPETTAQALALLKNKLPKLIGLPIKEDFDIMCDIQDAHYPVSLFGIEAAYMDLLAKTKNISLAQFFGATKKEVVAGESVGLQPSIRKTLKQVQQYINDGYSRIKIKIAPGKDEEILTAVRAVFPNIILAADANAAYTQKDINYLATFKKFNLSFIEQPFIADDFVSHAKLQALGISVCLDESIINFETCQEAISQKACTMINIKPARIGSFKESKKIYDKCVNNGIKLFGGGRLETGIGKTANTIFYGLHGFSDASDITPPSEYLEQDIINPVFTMSNAKYTIPKGIGIGVMVNEDVLKKFTVDHQIFS